MFVFVCFESKRVWRGILLDKVVVHLFTQKQYLGTKEFYVGTMVYIGSVARDASSDK